MVSVQLPVPHRGHVGLKPISPSTFRFADHFPPLTWTEFWPLTFAFTLAPQSSLHVPDAGVTPPLATVYGPHEPMPPLPEMVLATLTSPYVTSMSAAAPAARRRIAARIALWASCGLS